MKVCILLLWVVCVMLSAGCATHKTQTTLAGQAVAMNRPRAGDGPSVRIHIPNVRRIGPKTWPEAFTSIFGSVPIATAAFGAPIAVPLTALGGKTAVDLLRSGPDTVNDVIFDIDGLAESIELHGVRLGEQETIIENVTIRIRDVWRTLQDDSTGGIDGQQ